MSEHLQAVLDHAAGRVYVLAGRNTDTGHDCKLFGVFSTEGAAEHLKTQLRAAGTPYQLAITPIVQNIGVPAPMEFTPG